MSDIKLLPVVKSPQRNTADGTTTGNWRGTRDFVAFTAGYFENLAMQGRIFTANMGTVTTPITFLTTAANRPDAWIRVPAGTAILPLHLDIAFESMAGTDTEVDVRICHNDIGIGTSSAADVGPVSLRSDRPFSSACLARQLATGDTTAETNPVSIYRQSWSLAEASGVSSLGVHLNREDMGYPILIGGATWEVFVAATTTQAVGFVVMTWAEVPASDLT